MANQGAKPTLDGISRSRPIDGVGSRGVAEPLRKPEKSQSAPVLEAAPEPKPMKMNPPKPIGSLETKSNEGVLPADEMVYEPKAKKSLLAKLVKLVVVLVVLGALGAGMWWVYLSYFA
jgi:hypothetical protein